MNELEGDESVESEIDAESDGYEASSCSLADILARVDRYGLNQPTNLYEALCDDVLGAFVRLPASFDLSLRLPASLWQGIDQGDFCSDFGRSPYSASASFRVPSQLVIDGVAHALASRSLSNWDQVASGGFELTVFAPADELAEHEQALELDKLLNRTAHDLAKSADKLARARGYIPFVVIGYADAVFASTLEVGAPTGGRKRGARGNQHWPEVWRRLSGVLLKHRSLERKQAIHRAWTELTEAGLTGLPPESTIYARLSDAIKRGE